jgi:hypothetical protein
LQIIWRKTLRAILAYPSSMEQLAGLTEEARKLALDRFRLLQPHLEDDRPLKAVAASAGIPFRTAQRWAALYQQFGLAGLARKKRTDDGQHREISAKLKEVVEGIALRKPPLPVAAICRQVRRLAQDLGEEPPSYWVINRIVAALPAILLPSRMKEQKPTATPGKGYFRLWEFRPGSDRNARHGKTPGSLPAVLLAYRLRP